MFKVITSCTKERQGRRWKEAICLDVFRPLKSRVVPTRGGGPSPQLSSPPVLKVCVCTPIWPRACPGPALHGARRAVWCCQPWERTATESALTREGSEGPSGQGGLQTAPGDPTGSSQRHCVGRRDVQVGPGAHDAHPSIRETPLSHFYISDFCV